MHLRVARATDRLEEISRMYERGLGLSRVGSFQDHDGFDGVMLGRPGVSYHFEFTRQRGHSAEGTAGPENVVVFYVPDRVEWGARCEAMETAGFVKVRSKNPYWDVNGSTFEDVDAYRVVVQCAEWVSSSDGEA